MTTPEPVSIDACWDRTIHEPARTPLTSGVDHFATVSEYRDGAIFLANYAGSSQWERHPSDEIVTVVDGETTMTLFIDGAEVARTLRAGDLIVVPPLTWHRFDAPTGVKVMTVTPQPTEHHVGDLPPAD